LYAYCSNNPIAFVDISGCASLPFGLLIWPGEIHLAVQKRIYDTYGGSKSVAIEHYVGVGRVDIVFLWNNTIYEVKPCTWGNWRIQDARDQVNRYLEALGSSFSLGGYIYSDTFSHKDYEVTYWYKEEGIIYYSFRPKTREQTETNTSSAFLPKQAESKDEGLKKGLAVAITFGLFYKMVSFGNGGVERQIDTACSCFR